MLIKQLILSKVDYHNALYVNLPACDVKRVQSVVNATHLPNLVSPKVVLRLSDRALILFLSFCKLSEVLKYIYMSNKNRERSRRY